MVIQTESNKMLGYSIQQWFETNRIQWLVRISKLNPTISKVIQTRSPKKNTNENWIPQ